MPPGAVLAAGERHGLAPLPGQPTVVGAVGHTLGGAWTGSAVATGWPPTAPARSPSSRPTASAAATADGNGELS
jgi:hypothetical protein